MELMVEGGFQEEGEAANKWDRARLSSTQLCEYFLGSVGMHDLEAEARRRAEARRPRVRLPPVPGVGAGARHAVAAGDPRHPDSRLNGLAGLGGCLGFRGPLRQVQDRGLARRPIGEHRAPGRRWVVVPITTSVEVAGRGRWTISEV